MSFMELHEKGGCSTELQVRRISGEPRLPSSFVHRWEFETELVILFQNGALLALSALTVPDCKQTTRTPCIVALEQVAAEVSKGSAPSRL